MSEPNNTPSLLGEAFRSELEEIVKKTIQEAMGPNGHGGKVSLRMLINMLKPYLTVNEAAKLSRLGSSTIRLYIRKRELKAHQVGSRVIIKRTDLEGFLEAHPIEILSD